MPVPIIVLTGLAVALRLLMGGYSAIKPSLFVATISAGAICIFLYCLKKDVRQPIAARMLTIAVCMPLLAWSLPNLWLLFAILCLWVPMAAGGFSQVVPVYLFSLLLLPGLEEMLAIGSLNLMRFNVYNALVLGTAVAVFLNPGKAKCRAQWDVVAISVVVLLAVALARGTEVSHHIRMLLKVMLDLGLPYYAVSRGLRSQSEIRAAMLWLGAGGVIIAAIVLFEVSKGWPIYGELYRLHGLPTLLIVHLRGGMLRAGGPFLEPTSAAMLLVLCSIAMYLGKENFRGKANYYIVLGIMLVGLLAPQSRGAWVGLCFGLALADLLRARYVQLATKFLVLGGLVSVALIGTHASPYVSEKLGVSGESRDTIDYRQMLFDRGLEEFSKRPFTGYSVPELEVRLADLVQGDGIIDYVNAYIWIMLISGIGGFFIFVGAFVYFLTKIAAVGRFKGRRRRDVEAGVFAFVTIAVSMEMFFFTSFGTRPAISLFVFFGFGAAFIRLQQPTSRARQAPAIEVPSLPAMLPSNQ